MNFQNSRTNLYHGVDPIPDGNFLNVFIYNYRSFFRRLGRKSLFLERVKDPSLSGLVSLADLWMFVLINIFEILIQLVGLATSYSVSYYFYLSVVRIISQSYKIFYWVLYYARNYSIVFILLIAFGIYFHGIEPESRTQQNDAIPDNLSEGSYDDEVSDRVSQPDSEPDEFFEQVENTLGTERMEEIRSRMRRRVPFNRVGGIGHRTMSRGCGGNSKVRREPQAPEGHVQGNDPNEEVDEDLDIDYFKNPDLYKNFVYSADPGLKSTFTLEELLQPHDFINFDCHGAPFCGLVCLDIAVGKKVIIDDYITRIQVEDDVFDNGSLHYLKQYANFRGVNLAVIDRDVLYRFSNNPLWDYVVLFFNEDPDEESNGIGHWTLALDACGTKGYVEADKLVYDAAQIFASWFGIIRVMKTYFLLREYGNSHNLDHRQSINTRDPIEMRETYADLSFRYSIWFCAVEWPINDDLVDNLYLYSVWCVNDVFVPRFRDWQIRLFQRAQGANNVVGFLCLRILTFCHYLFELLINNFLVQLLILASTSILSSLCSWYFDGLRPGSFTISASRAKRVLQEAEMVDEHNRLRCLGLISQMRFVHDTVNIDRLYLNTRTYCEDVIRSMKPRRVVQEVHRVAVNANSCRSLIPNIANIQQNQLRGLIGTGLNGKKYYNFVRKSRVKKIIRNRVVATAPTLVLFNRNKQLGPGHLPVTDSIGTLTAFARSLTTDPDNIDLSVFRDFEQFSHKFIDRVISTIDFSGVVELDPMIYFSEHYKRVGRPQSYIDGVLNDYQSYLMGSPPKDFMKNTCFVKLENSVKVKDGSVRTRPRLIMVMNGPMLVEYCQVIDCIDLWNDSYFKKFQIKHMSVEAMLEVVRANSDRDHIVTDYSSFEASIHGVVRSLENYCIKEMLSRSRLVRAYNRFLSDGEGSRILKTSDHTFNINSRNSGDFHTSWMNGLQNVLLSAYCYHKQYPEDLDFVNFSMVAEGDDGLRRPTEYDNIIPQQLGFSFSQAVAGKQPGDVDFLRCRWVEGKRYMNVARVLKLCWVLGDHRRNRSLEIQRCAALSLYYLCPGHPILMSLVKRIGRETAHICLTKAGRRFLREMQWKAAVPVDVLGYQKNFDSLTEIDESMRPRMALGTIGFPPISVGIQLELENALENFSNVDLVGVLDEYEEIFIYENSSEWRVNHHLNHHSCFSDEVIEFMEVVGADYSSHYEKDYYDHGKKIFEEFFETLTA